MAVAMSDKTTFRVTGSASTSRARDQRVVINQMKDDRQSIDDQAKLENQVLRPKPPDRAPNPLIGEDRRRADPTGQPEHGEREDDLDRQHRDVEVGNARPAKSREPKDSARDQENENRQADDV